ncbi:hypothetical protein ACJX0J_009420 [Zea mays]
MRRTMPNRDLIESAAHNHFQVNTGKGSHQQEFHAEAYHHDFVNTDIKTELKTNTILGQRGYVFARIMQIIPCPWADSMFYCHFCVLGHINLGHANSMFQVIMVKKSLNKNWVQKNLFKCEVIGIALSTKYDLVENKWDITSTINIQ